MFSITDACGEIDFVPANYIAAGIFQFLEHDIYVGWGKLVYEFM